MSKVRVYELSKELGINSKKLITVLHKLNIDVKNHMSTMDRDIAKKVIDMLTKGEVKPIEQEGEPEKKEDAKEETKIEAETAVKAPEKKKESSPPPKRKAGAKKTFKEGRKARRTARLSEKKNDTPEE